MSKFSAVASLVRYGAEDMVFQLRQLPEDKLDWKPTPECKSALQVVAEVIGVMQAALPVFQGDGFAQPNFPQLTSLDEAIALLSETAERYAAALEAAGPELERVEEVPYGKFWASRAVLFGAMDLLHHHGQITYLQSLLGDAEIHTDMGVVARFFGPPAEASAE